MWSWQERAQQGVLPKCIVPELGIIVQEVAIRKAKDEILRELQARREQFNFFGGDGNKLICLKRTPSKIRSLCERASDIGRIPQSLKRIVEVGDTTEARCFEQWRSFRRPESCRADSGDAFVVPYSARAESDTCSLQ